MPIQAVIGGGDEAIIFDPAYDAYEPAVRLAGGRCIRIPLTPPAFRFDWDRVRRNVTERTRLVIINSPQNPSCSVAERTDLEALAALVRDRPITHSRRRGLRERALRRPPPRLGAGASGTARTQLRGVFIRQDTACHRLARRLLRRAARADGGTCARCINSTPSASPRRCNTRSPATWSNFPTPGPVCRRFSRPSATCSPGCCAVRDSSRCARRAPISCWSITARSAAQAISSSPTG